jgi:hypothetical protein
MLVDDPAVDNSRVDALQHRHGDLMGVDLVLAKFDLHP